MLAIRAQQHGPPLPRRLALARQLKSWATTVALMAAVFFGVQTLRPGPVVKTTDQGAAPGFALMTTDGNVVRLEDFRGRPVLLNFWATWCPPCRVELPSLAAFSREHPDVAVLGIAVASGDAAQLRDEKVRLEIPYPVLLADQAVVNAYGASALPTTVLVAPDGRVHRSWVGLVFGWQVAAALGDWKTSSETQPGGG